MFTRISFILFFILGAGTNLFAQKPIKKAPLNPEFVQYQKLSKEKQKAMGYIPSPFRIKSVIPKNYSLEWFPDYYQTDCITPVDDQQTTPHCWAYASTGGVEQQICRESGEITDLSEECLAAYKNAHYMTEGGNTEMASSYYSSRSGPVLEGDDCYNIGNYNLPTFPEREWYINVTGSSGKPYSQRINEGSLRKKSKLLNQMDTLRNIIKKFIYEKGAVLTSLHFSRAFYDSINYTYYCDISDTIINHSVLLVGWDDSLQTAATETGAWIAKNSWGTAFGDSGYFYLSYYDSLALTNENAIWTELDFYVPNEHLYMNDQLGRVYSLGYDNTNTGYGLAKFEAINEVPITEIMTWTTMGDAYVSIWIYDDFDGSNLRRLISQSLNNYREFAGYSMYELPTPIYLPEGDDFYIKIEYKNPQINSYPIPSESYIEEYCDPIIQRGKYWISSDGNHWYGIGAGTDNLQNLAIRAYAKPVKPLWRKLRSGTNANLWGVHFTCPNTGYVVGNEGTILKTTDAGENWFPLSSGTNNSLSSIYFVNENTGWIVGHYGTILKTTNAGETWNPQSSGTGNWLGDVYFIDENHGFIVGYNGIILRTNNGGTSWESLSSGTNERLYSVRFVDQNTGWASGWHGTIIKTEDGGDSWTSISSGTGEDISTLCFTAPNTAWAAADNGTMLKSTDGGENWAPQPSPAFLNLYTVGFCDQNTGWMLGDKGSILKTTDGGESWEFEPSGTKNLLFAAHFPAENVGYAVGMDGTIITNRDSVASAVKENVSPPTGYALYQNYPNPFNSTTTFKFAVPHRANVTLKLYNVRGNEICSLVNKEFATGIYKVHFQVEDLPSGIYFYRIQADDFVQVKKLTLLK